MKTKEQQEREKAMQYIRNTPKPEMQPGQDIEQYFEQVRKWKWVINNPEVVLNAHIAAQQEQFNNSKTENDERTGDQTS